MTFWSGHFGWPGGDVYGNLIASGICTGLVYWRARIHLRRQRETLTRRLEAQHQEHIALHETTHALVQALHEQRTMPSEDET